MAQQRLDQEREEPTRRGFLQLAGQTVSAGGAVAVLGTVRQPLGWLENGRLGSCCAWARC